MKEPHLVLFATLLLLEISLVAGISPAHAGYGCWGGPTRSGCKSSDDFRKKNDWIISGIDALDDCFKSHDSNFQNGYRRYHAKLASYASIVDRASRRSYEKQSKAKLRMTKKEANRRLKLCIDKLDPDPDKWPVTEGNLEARKIYKSKNKKSWSASEAEKFREYALFWLDFATRNIKTKSNQCDCSP